MRRIGVISDTHHDRGQMEFALMKMEAEGRLDCLIHCGDVAGDVDFIGGNILQVVAVRGNCDGWMSEAPLDRELNIAGINFFITHGHRYDIRWDLTMLEDRARELGVDVIFFGHSHRPAILQFPESGLTCYNPGSIALPRQFQPMGPTFMLLDVDDDGTLHPTHCYFGPRGKKFISFDLAPEVIQ